MGSGGMEGRVMWGVGDGGEGDVGSGGWRGG